MYNESSYPNSDMETIVEIRDCADRELVKVVIEKYKQSK